MVKHCKVCGEEVVKGDGIICAKKLIHRKCKIFLKTYPWRYES